MINKLRKDGGITAVDKLNIDVQKGSIYGFVGANGAGKTTTVKMILGLVDITSGSGTLLGQPLGSIEARKKIGFLPERFTLPGRMTTKEFLIYIALMFGFDRKKCKELANLYIQRLALEEWTKRKLSTLSKGQVQRVAAAGALINDPELIIFDEPTSGLDPLGRREFLELMKYLAKDLGRTVFFSTHILNDVDDICEKVAIIDHGKLLTSGDLSVMKNEHGARDMEELYEKIVGAPTDILARWR